VQQTDVTGFRVVDLTPLGGHPLTQSRTVALQVSGVVGWAGRLLVPCVA